jgi:predicted nucleic acid-binding protein
VIVLDTNVVSEPLRPVPAPQVLAWLDRQSPATLYLTAVNVAELMDGVARLPDGRRRADLEAALATRVLPLFSGRVLPFDEAAAFSFARLHARSREHGHSLGLADAYIAAIAASRGFAVATRDTAPFVAAGVEVIDPWAL